MLTRDRLQRIRIRKIEELKKLGVNAYPSLCHREQIIDQAQRMEGRQVVVAGRLTNLRGHGKIIFADLKDQSGKIQIAFKADLLKPQSFSLLSFVDVSDFLSISGKVGKTQAGEMTVFADNFQIISKAIRSLPDQWYGLKDIEERYRKRYLDLVMNEKVFGVFRIRAQIIHFIREYLDSRGYIEVETPVLQPVYGGGLARPFKTYHNALGIPLYLRISTELYLKRLIVGGFEKVYEIARLFRNEGIDRNHAPEFTMLETMEAYIDYRENMKLVEEMTEYIVKKIFGGTKIQYLKNFIDFETPWKRVTMVEAVKEATGFDYYQIKNIEEAKKQARDLGVELEESENTVGFILASIFKNKVETTLIQPTIIYDFPVETSPLAKRKEEDPRFVERFEHFIAGMECSNNYSELNDPQELEKRLVDERKKEKLGDQEAHQMDYDFIEALEYGMPPTSGIGPGIDRLVMILTNSPNLREVILFPTMRPREAIKPAKAEEIKNLPSCKQTPINIPTTDSSKFSLIDNAVKNKFPGTRVGVAYIKDVKIEKTSAELELYKKEVIDSLQGLRTADIDSFSTIAAYRKLFKGFGVDWHSRRPSPDALLRRIALGKGLYKVNTLVDAYNLAVLKTKIGLGAFDADRIIPPVVLRCAQKGDKIILLGEEKETAIGEGELIYSDQNRVITLDLNYRDCDYTKVTQETKNILLFADGCDGITLEELQQGLTTGIDLIIRFCGGNIEYKAIIDPLSKAGKFMFTREKALEILHNNMQNQNLRRHCYAVEAVMRALAKKFGEDEDSWGIAGLLHDADYEQTKNDPAKHVVTVVAWLKEAGVDEKVVNAVYSHGWKYVAGCPEPSTNMEWSLYCCDELTGLIVAVALVRPDKKLSTVTVESVLKKWDNKSFAAGASREQIKLCEEKLQIKLPDFISIALSAMQGISDDLGL